MENSSARRTALGDQRGPPTGIVEQRPAARRGARRRRPAGPAAPPGRRGTPCGSRRCRRPRPACRPPWPRGAPRRTTRRRAPGSTRWWRRAGEPASPPPTPARATRPAARRRPRSASCSGPSPMTQRSASRSRPANASSSTSRPLRRSCRPTKTIAGAIDGVTGPGGERGHVDPVRQDLALAAEGQGDLSLGLLGDRGGHRQAAHHRLEAGPEGLVPAVAARARGVEGADRGDGGADERGVVGAGRQRLVEVEHVGLERAQRLDGAPGDGPAGGDRRDRAVARHPGARTDGGDARLGRRTVARERRCGRRPRPRAVRGRARAPDPAPRRTASASTGTKA